MSAMPCDMQADVDVNVTGPAPFATVYVTLTKQEHIQLVTEANYWKSSHHRATLRLQWAELEHRRVLEQAALREASLRSQLEVTQAKIRDMQQRVFGRKSERSKGAGEGLNQELALRLPRGQQRGKPGHGRAMLPHLPARVEVVELANATCPKCGLGLSEFPGTEDAETLEVEVQAYRRVIRRRRYRSTCNCACLPGIVTAPAPARLIERGKFGVSVWSSVLLDKFLYGRPSHRLLQDLANHGLNMAPGTLAGGLKALAPLFVPLEQALVQELRGASHWHADETRWAVFVQIQGKVGHRWYLWVFHSSSVVHYVLNESRSAEVIETELAGVQGGIISCDRYSAYKKFARLHPGVVLAFCWAHVRRDLLELANAYPDLSSWAFAGLDAIGMLYHLNGLRLQAPEGSQERAAHHALLEQAVQGMARQRDIVLADPLLAAPAAKVLQSMQAHWDGLTVFVNHPGIPMDNNTAELDMRGPVVGRKNFYGSASQWSGQLAATMYSVMMTLRLWKINARTWLGAYLQACVDNGNRAPRDIAPFLPWAMEPARLAAMRACAPVHAHVQGIDSS
jgi:transposase